MKKAFTLIELLIVVAIIAILAAIAVPNFLEAQTRAKVSRAKADCRTFDIGANAYMVDWNKMPMRYCDQRLMSGAVDNTVLNCEIIFAPLTTPTAYLTTSRMTDPFLSATKVPSGTQPIWRADAANPNTPHPYYSSGYIGAIMAWTPVRATITSAATGTSNQANAVTYGDRWAFQGFPERQAAVVYSFGPSGIRTNPVGQWRLWMNKVGATYGNPPIFYTYDAAVANSLYDPTNGTVSGGALTRWIGDTGGMPSSVDK